jgi:hypothetical protein
MDVKDSLQWTKPKNVLACEACFQARKPVCGYSPKPVKAYLNTSLMLLTKCFLWTMVAAGVAGAWEAAAAIGGSHARTTHLPSSCSWQLSSNAFLSSSVVSSGMTQQWRCRSQ